MATRPRRERQFRGTVSPRNDGNSLVVTLVEGLSSSSVEINKDAQFRWVEVDDPGEEPYLKLEPVDDE